TQAPDRQQRHAAGPAAATVDEKPHAHLPNRAHCRSAYSCVAWHIPSKLDGRYDRRRDCVLSRYQRKPNADSAPMLSVAVLLLAALRLPGSAQRRVNGGANRLAADDHAAARVHGRPNLKEPVITNVAPAGDAPDAYSAGL